MADQPYKLCQAGSQACEAGCHKGKSFREDAAIAGSIAVSPPGLTGLDRNRRSLGGKILELSGIDAVTRA
jgi:hypothetical protein